MAPSNETRPLGAAGLGELSFRSRIDNPTHKSRPPISQAAISRFRRQRLVEHLHRLGPSPLGHFIREVEVATRADVSARLERYSEIDPEFVCALGGDRFAPSLHFIDGRRTR